MLPPTPFRLAWVVPGSIEQLTGGYLYDAQIVRGLRARGHRVRVVELPGRAGPLQLGAVAHLVRALAGRRWDAVVVDELAHGAMVLGLPALRVTGSGRSATLVALVHHLRCSEPLSGPARRRATAVERAALAHIDLALCTSASTAASVRPLVRPGLPIEVVAPGCDLHPARLPDGVSKPVWVATARERPPAQGAAAPSRSWRTSPSASLRVLTVAHWTPRKGVVETLGALALTPPSISLDLVGDPDRDPAYARQVRAALRRPELAGRVRVHGRVSSERLAELYGQADALALASSHEGYGTVLAEALAAGLPIVATRVGAVPEVVRDGREAELVEAGDETALAHALARLARDPTERQRRAVWATERATSLPSWAESCGAFAAALDRAIVRRAGSRTGGSRTAPTATSEPPGGRDGERR